MKRSYVVIILGLLFIVSSCNLFNKNRRHDKDFYDFNVTRSKDNNPDNTKKPVIKEPVKKRFEKVEVIKGDNNRNLKYFVILGSFSQRYNADRFVNKLTEQGFSPSILRSEVGLYRVSGFQFNNENSARAKIKNIRENYPEYNDLWLLINK